MRIICLLIILTLSFVNLNAQTPCGDLSIQKGVWTQTPPTGKDAQAVKNITTAMSLFQKSVAGFAGGQAKTYTFTADLVDVPNKKIQGYTVALNFLQFECISGKIKPQAATDTWLYIGFNEFPFFRSNNKIGQEEDLAEKNFQLPNGQRMFYSQYKFQGEFKGYPKLVPIFDNEGISVFLSNSKRLPFKNLTQAEVLTAYKKYYQVKKTSFFKGMEDVLAKEPADIARIDADKQMAGREASKKALIESNNRVRTNLAQYKKELTICLENLDAYIANPISKQPAIVETIDDYCKPEQMFNPKSNPKQIVAFDENFFDKSLSPAAPQFIVVYWRTGDANYKTRDGLFRFPIKREFINKFETNFDFASLGQMLEK